MTAALMMIDFQKGIDFPKWGKRSTPMMEETVEMIFNECRAHSFPIIHIKHDSVEENSPYRPGQVGNDFKDCARPLDDEKVFIKHTNNAFVDTGLDEYLKSKNITQLFIGGVLLEHCVGMAAKHASCLGYDVIILSDASASVSQKNNLGEIDGETIKAFLLKNFMEDYGNVISSDKFINNHLKSIT